MHALHIAGSCLFTGGPGIPLATSTSPPGQAGSLLLRSRWACVLSTRPLPLPVRYLGPSITAYTLLSSGKLQATKNALFGPILCKRSFQNQEDLIIRGNSQWFLSIEEFSFNYTNNIPTPIYKFVQLNCIGGLLKMRSNQTRTAKGQSQRAIVCT